MLIKQRPTFKEKQKISTEMIKEVYEDNYIEEIERLSLRLEQFKYISMDTEFPGVIFQPSNNSKDQYYKSVKKNVDSLKLIQVGVTLCDQGGNYPPDIATWQFNLKFDINIDKYSNESIALLTNSGINFEVLAKQGIPIEKFGEYLITSGLLLNEDIYWVSFHGIYDFAYLLKVITGLPLPDSDNQFFEHLKLYFPHYYDIRHLVRFTENLRGSLNKLGQELNINRIGIQHQAGSDSIITSEIFFKLKNEYLSEELIHSDKNVLFGLGFEEDETELYFNSMYYGQNPGYKNNFIPNTNKFHTTNFSNVEYANGYFPQNIYGLQNNFIPQGTSRNNAGNYFPPGMNMLPNINPYSYSYTPNNMNFPSYNIPLGNKMTQSSVQCNNGKLNEEKKKLP